MAKENNDSMNYLTVRVNAALRTEFDNFCNALRLTASQVIKLFILYYIRTNDASFCFAVDTEPSDKTGKTEVISVWLGVDHRKQFSDMAKPNMSALVRGYMRYCIKHGIPNVVLSYQGVVDSNREVLQEQISVIESIERPLSNGAVDDTTAKQFAETLRGVRHQLNDVMDNI